MTTKATADSYIQDTIRGYLGDGEISPHTLRCFVGMIETGEATAGDFAAVGGVELAARVVANWWHSA